MIRAVSPTDALPRGCVSEPADAEPAELADPAADEAAELSHSARAHAGHFLSRTLRCRGEDMDRVMRLYHHSELMRQVVPELLADHPEATRAAIALRAAPPSPHVIVTRDGRFVTCLDETMAIDLPRIPHAAIAARIDADDLARGRRLRAQRQLARLSPLQLGKGLLDGYGAVTREMVDIVLEEPTTYLPIVLEVFLRCYPAWVRAFWARARSPLPKVPYRRQLSLEATCRMCFPLLGAVDAKPITDYLAEFLRSWSTFEIDVIAALCRHEGGGEALLGLMEEPTLPSRTQELIAGYVTTHLVYFPRHSPALLPRMRALAQLDRGWVQMESMRAFYDTRPGWTDEQFVAEWEAERRRPLARRLPEARSFEIARIDYLDSVHKSFPVSRFFPPAAQAQDARKRWARELLSRPVPPRPRSGKTPLIHAAPRVGRNDPCPCGSGRKHKQCCLRGLSAGYASSASSSATP